VAGLRAAGSVAGLVSPRATNEEMVALRDFFNATLHSHAVSLLYGELPPRDLGVQGTLADLDAADLILLAGGQPLAGQKVAGYAVKRAVDRGASLIVAAGVPAELDAFAVRCLPLDRIAEAAAEVDGAARPVVLCAAGLDPAVYDFLAGLPVKTRFLPLYEGTNAIGAANAGLGALPIAGAALYVMAADDLPGGRELPAAGFTVVQSAYRTAWTDAADVVLPALTWAEKGGHIVNLEGRELAVLPVLQPAAGDRADGPVLAGLAERLVG
jgi:predicted molibdopterin-dependent oxidoreductase YjgC